MNYGALLSRTWDVLWKNKTLILLGLLVALSSSGSGGNSASAGAQWIVGMLEGEWQALPLPDMDGFPKLPDIRWGPDIPVTPILVGAALGGMVLLFVLAVWVASTLGRGGLIAGVGAIQAGAHLDARQALGVAWGRVGALLTIGLLPAIPVALLLLTGMGAALLYNALRVQNVVPGAVILSMLACVAVPASLAFRLLHVFANRACLIEGLGAWDAIRRGAAVLAQHIGPALLLWLIEVLVTMVLGIAALLPTMALALCCIAWPVQLLLHGVAAAFFSTMWTLAWREWVGSEAEPASG